MKSNYPDILTYMYESREVVLLDKETAELVGASLASDDYQMQGDCEPYIINDEVAESVRKMNINPMGTYLTSYGDIANMEEAEKIDLYEMVNVENEQRLTLAWETTENYLTDVAERELLISTSRHHDWTSERSRMLDKIWRANNGSVKDIEQYRSEWEEICASYLDNLNSLNDSDASFDSLTREILGEYK